MSVKIKISYTDDQELTGIIRLLSPIVKKWKKQPEKGKYKRAYIEIENRDFSDDIIKSKTREK